MVLVFVTSTVYVFGAMWLVQLITAYIFLFPIELGLAQEQELIRLSTLYNEVQQQLFNLQDRANAMQDSLVFWNNEVDNIAQNGQQFVSTDTELMAQVVDMQARNGGDLTKLLNCRDLWKRNFAIMNKTFANMRKNGRFRP